MAAGRASSKASIKDAKSRLFSTRGLRLSSVSASRMA
jgi:hypothetical protein